MLDRNAEASRACPNLAELAARFSPSERALACIGIARGILTMEDSTKDKIEGEAHRLNGKSKTRAGHAIGDLDMVAEGKVEKADGKVQKHVGKLERKIEKLLQK